MAKSLRSADVTTGGSWYKSPIKIICLPPNGRFGSPPLSRRTLSMQSARSARAMDTSSMTIASSFLTNRYLSVSGPNRLTFFRVMSGPNLQNEWIVCPRTLTAATQVGANTAIFFLVWLRNQSSRVDLPVPARPVTNTLSVVSPMTRRASRASEEKVRLGIILFFQSFLLLCPSLLLEVALIFCGLGGTGGQDRRFFAGLVLIKWESAFASLARVSN